MKANINKIIEMAGGKTELARKLGVSPPYVSKMIKQGRIPVVHCREVEYITKGMVTAEMLEPLVFKPSFVELTRPS